MLQQLLADPAARHFKVLPDPVLYAEYYAVISRPVCLADLARLAAGPARYPLADLQRDLRRMLSNAKRFNRAEAVVYQDALVLEVREATARARGRAWRG